MDSSDVHAISLRNKRNCRTSFSTSKTRNISFIIAIWIGWQVVVRFYGMLLLSAKCPRPPGRREKLRMKDALENHSKGPIVPFGAMVEYHPISPRDFSRIHQFGNKVLPGIFLGYEPIAGDLKRRCSDCRFRRIGKVGRIRHLSQKTECKRSPDNLQRRRICISCGRWFNNIITKRLRIPRTHSETGTHRKERESQRRISRR